MAASELGKRGVLVRLGSRDDDPVGRYRDLPSVAAVLKHLQAKLGVRGTLSTVDGSDLHGDESDALSSGTFLSQRNMGNFTGLASQAVIRQQNCCGKCCLLHHHTAIPLKAGGRTQRTKSFWMSLVVTNQPTHKLCDHCLSS